MQKSLHALIYISFMFLYISQTVVTIFKIKSSIEYFATRNISRTNKIVNGQTDKVRYSAEKTKSLFLKI